MRQLFITIFLIGLMLNLKAQKQPSIVQQWVDLTVEMIILEGRGPTIHSRNMFHLCAGMYDAWAVYDKKASPYFLGNKFGDYHIEFDDDFNRSGNIDSLQEVAISYAAYRILHHRFSLVGSKGRTIDILENFIDSLPLDFNIRSTSYQDGSAAALGNYIAASIIAFGEQDGSGELNNHEIENYQPLNPQLKPYHPGNNTLLHPNRWQPIYVREYVEKKGYEPNLYDWNYSLLESGDIFLTPEWGKVYPFALTEEDKEIKSREEEYHLYLDPGAPPLIETYTDSVFMDDYRWGFLLVGLWSSHLDPSDSIMWDISPAAIGGDVALPNSYKEYQNYYNLMEGGTKTKGHKINPYTKKPYAPNIVPRGDYTRVVAEYWADAVNTASPPGHWFAILSDVSQHPQLEKKWAGKGPTLTNLEWDIKANFTLAGAMHDAAIAAWGAKGYYDYVRPISAIRWMAKQGQCSDSKLPNYNKKGLPLIKGKIELVTKRDPLVGENKEHLNKIKIWAWRGPEHIANTLEDEAKVGWILVENWWPFQRYSFPTPPFAGFVSGHSTFSVAAAEVLTQITGNPYFPGGIAEFTAKKNEFLVFENGPSRDITLQWATYQDAAYETCLSRIWGGIHPPADDIAGRKMGREIGKKSYQLVNTYFKEK